LAFKPPSGADNGGLTSKAQSSSILARRVDPYSVRLFVCAARAGSIVRAAEQEHIAPSALSRRLADLEHAFGTPLLIRSPRGVALTDAGRLVLARGEKIDEDLQALVREVQTEGGEIRGTVRLYANMSAVIGFLPERLRAFMAACPEVEVSLQEQDTRDVIRACLDDRADVGVGVGAGVDMPVPAGLESWHFATDPLQVVLPAGHALARKRAMRFAQALEHPLIGVHQGGALDRSLHERAEALHLPFAPTVSVSSFDAVCRMVEAGLGIAVIPQSAAAAYAGNPRFVRCATTCSRCARRRARARSTDEITPSPIGARAPITTSASALLGRYPYSLPGVPLRARATCRSALRRRSGVKGGGFSVTVAGSAMARAPRASTARRPKSGGHPPRDRRELRAHLPPERRQHRPLHVDRLRPGRTHPCVARRSTSRSWSPRATALAAAILRSGGLLRFGRERMRTISQCAGVASERPANPGREDPRAPSGGDRDAPATLEPGSGRFVRADWRFIHEYYTGMCTHMLHKEFGRPLTLHDPATILAFEDHLSYSNRSPVHIRPA
jgi:DNA-binding transcriptional LysR family regulator